MKYTLQHQPFLNPMSASFFCHSHLLPAITPGFPPFTTTKFTCSPVQLFLMISLEVFVPEHPFFSHQTVWCFTSNIASYFLCLQVLTCYKPQPDFLDFCPADYAPFGYVGLSASNSCLHVTSSALELLSYCSVYGFNSFNEKLIIKSKSDVDNLMKYIIVILC